MLALSVCIPHWHLIQQFPNIVIRLLLLVALQLTPSSFRHILPRPLFHFGGQLLEILHGRLSSDKDASEGAAKKDIQGEGGVGGEGGAGGVETYDGDGAFTEEEGLHYLKMPEWLLEKVTRWVALSGINAIDLLFHLADDTHTASSMNGGF